MEEKEIDGYKATELIASGVITSNDIANGILYDEIKDIEIEILEYKDNNFKTKDSRIIPVNWLNVGKKQLIIVNPSECFINKIEGAKTPYEKRLETLQINLSEIGSTGINRLNIEEQEFINNLLNLKNLISAKEREKFFEIAKRTENYSWASRIYSKWLYQFEKSNKDQPDATGRMHLTYFFRHAGRFKEAIKTSNVFEFPYSKLRCNDRLRAVIGTIRAATFLDIYDYHQDKDILSIARKTAGKAWANGPSEELRGVYQRLENLERDQSANSYKRRLKQAYSDWKDWTK